MRGQLSIYTLAAADAVYAATPTASTALLMAVGAGAPSAASCWEAPSCC